MKGKTRWAAALVAALMSAAAPEVALAHIVKGVGDFYAGMLHPVTTLEHLLPMVALGLLAGQSSRKTAIGMLVAFPLALLAGSVASLWLGLPPFAVWMNLSSILVLGGLVALGKPIPNIPMVLIAALFGLTHGLANGAEMVEGMKALRFFPGVALVGFLSTVYGIGLVRWLKAPWAQIGVRVVGSWIAAIGLMVTALG